MSASDVPPKRTDRLLRDQRQDDEGHGEQNDRGPDLDPRQAPHEIMQEFAAGQHCNQCHTAGRGNTESPKSANTTKR